MSSLFQTLFSPICYSLIHNNLPSLTLEMTVHMCGIHDVFMILHIAKSQFGIII